MTEKHLARRKMEEKGDQKREVTKGWSQGNWARGVEIARASMSLAGERSATPNQRTTILEEETSRDTKKKKTSRKGKHQK